MNDDDVGGFFVLVACVSLCVFPIKNSLTKEINDYQAKQ